MRLKIFFIVFLMMAFSAHANENIKQLFGYMPGEISSIPSSANRNAFDVVLVPVQSEILGRFFYDLQLFSILPENRISGISTRKAFIDQSSCEKQRKQLHHLLSETFEQPYQGADPLWQFQSSKGEIVAKCACVTEGKSPYPVLLLVIEHVETAKEQQRLLREISP